MLALKVPRFLLKVDHPVPSSGPDPSTSVSLNNRRNCTESSAHSREAGDDPLTGIELGGSERPPSSDAICSSRLASASVTRWLGRGGGAVRRRWRLPVTP